MLKRVSLWIRSIVLRRRLEREMQEEMAEHLERATARLLARGLSEEEARREALREFGNLGYLQEEARNARGTRWLDALTEDSRFALRQFRRRWGTVLTMFVILSFGMVISTLLFTYVHWYATSPPPAIPQEEDLVRIRGSHDAGLAGRGLRALSLEELEEYRRLTDQFRAVAGWAEAAVSVDAGDAEDLRGLLAEATFVTENYFAVLGIQPLLGPGLPVVPSEGTTAVAVIGHAAWDRLFGGSPDVIGRTIEVNGVPVTIAGVAPPRFIGVGGGNDIQLWMPLQSRHLVLPEATVQSLAYRAAGRLHPGVRPDEATAAARVIAARAAANDPKLAEREPGTEVVPLLAANGDPMHERDVRLLSVLLGALGLLVLAVACTNVAALQTGLAMARRHEIAVRLSLGASRSRIVRQLLTESALLALAAGATALGILWTVFRAVQASFPVMPVQVGITWETTAFTFGVALAVGSLFGVSPALHASRVAIASALQDSAAAIASTRLRLQRALVVAQIALTQPLIVLLASVLLVVLGTFQSAERSALADQLITLRLRSAVWTPGQGDAGTESAAQLQEELRRLRVRLESTPGVAAAVIDSENRGELGRYAVHPGDRVAGGSQEAFRVSGQTASPGYFSVRGVPLLRGREFASADAGAAGETATELPVVIGSDLAGRLWPGADPLGRRLRAADDSASGAATLVVTGVVADPGGANRDSRKSHAVYLPAAPGAARPAFLIRTVGPAEPLIPQLRTAVREEVPGRVANVATIAAIEDEARRSFRLVTGALAGSGFLALLLSAIGLYAVIAFAVGQRTAEIAVRVAVGAPPRRIAGRFVADGFRLSVLGLGLGLPLSLLGLRGYNVLAPLDDSLPSVALPPVAVAATVAIVLVTLAATLVPARRATRVSPALALRRE